MTEDKTRILPELGKVDVGTQLSGIYELDQHLASGGMGEVYRGQNIQTGDHVAIKIVLPEFARDQMVLSLFRKEASILNHLGHEAIVRYHVFTIDPVIGRPYLAMEFVDGDALIEVIRRGPMAIDAARKLAARLAAGLQAVHDAHTLHRDLSPDNIILPGGRVDRAKIIDFGIARSAVGESTLLGGRFAGKYNYVSPEQLGLYGGEVSERSDIYSLGLVLAAALRGKPLDMNGSQLEVIEKRRVVPDLSGIDPSIRPMLEAMLQPDPAYRPASMSDVVALASDAPGTVPPRASTAPAGFVEHKRPAFLEQQRKPSAPASKAGSRLAIAAVALLVLVAAGAGTYWFWPDQPEQPAVVRTQPQPSAVETARIEPSTRTEAETATPADQVTPATTTPESSQPTVEEPETVVVPPTDEALTPIRPDTEQATVEQEPSNASTPAEETKPDNRPGPSAPSDKVDTVLNVPPFVPQPPSRTEEEPHNPPTGQDTASEALDAVAQRISWLHDYPGGSCFYATATDASDSAIAVEGFGTAREPFLQMLEAFQSRFGIEPDVSVRLIDPNQCAVTAFLRDLPGTSDRPQLTLDRTSVPNGTPVSGGFDKEPGRVSNLLLIDHDGMVFNLDSRLTAQGERNSFSIPIGLSAADKGRDGGVPQVIIAVSARQPIAAASFKEPRPARDVLPAILAEIKAQKVSAAATAKYFRLGG